MDKDNKSRAIRPFDTVLREVSGGRLLNDLTDEMTQVIDAVVRSGRVGELRLSLKFKPRGSDNSQIEIVSSIKAVAPELERPFSIFYVNRDCGLQRNDPNQPDLLGLKGVESVDADTGEVLVGGAK